MSIRTILITGTSRGIGYETALKLLKQGHCVIGLSRSKTDISHPNFIHYSLDLSILSQLEAFFKNTLKNHPEISAIILNAGVGYFGFLEQLSFQQMQECFNTNFFSHAVLCKIFLPHLKRLSKSDIIFIGSEAALKGAKAGSIYCASKFALQGFFESLKQECLKSHVKVSMIHPGMVRTDFHKNTYFEPGPDPDNAIDTQSLANLILMILESSPYITFDEIRVNPLKKIISFKEKSKIGT